MHITKKKVLISYLIIDFFIFLFIFLINLIGAKSNFKDALLASLIFGIPIALLGGSTGLALMFRYDANEAFENNDLEDENRKNWENKYKLL